MKKLLAILAVLSLFAIPATAQKRGGDNESGAVEVVDARNVSVQGKQWAVFIAIDEYREWSPLLYPVKDAREIKDILLKYYHINEVRELYNRDATVANIRKLLTDLQTKTGINDSVFVFHAGHGVNNEVTKTSAWIPYDGGEDEYAQLNWLSHLQIRSMLDSLNARHVFLISDSCYSGDLLSTSRGAADTITSYPAAYDKVSRQAMSSGASEEVDDVSEFASRLKDILMRTETAYITPDYLLSQIKEAQTTRPLYTIPVLAVLPQSSHGVGGSFLFFRKNPKPDAAVQSAVAQKPAPSASVPSPLPAVAAEPAAVQGAPGEYAYFVGSWITTVEHKGSFDTYQINLSANGRCTVKMSNDSAEQEASGNWSYDGTMFKLNAVFKNAKITYQRNIQWVSIVNFSGGNNAFNILAKTAANAPNNIRFTFFRD